MFDIGFFSIAALAVVFAGISKGGFGSGAAFAATQEDRRGLLARGYGGDLTVLDVDLTQLGLGDAKRALEATVLMTVVNGEILHDAR